MSYYNLNKNARNSSFYSSYSSLSSSSSPYYEIKYSNYINHDINQQHVYQELIYSTDNDYEYYL
jgi:hypothetical protein